MLIFCTCFHSKASASGRLQINITNLKGKGSTYIAIYNTAEGFCNPLKAFRRVVLHSSGATTALTSEELPSGNYAIAVYEDVNNNQRIDKNFFGIPTEPFAFSNNVRPVVCAPTFKQCAITFDKPEETISIKLMTYF